MVNSAYDPESDEVYAFEELVGSHGGMGGPQAFPFVLVPSDWAVPDQPIVGAEAMHQWMRRWLKDLGQPLRPQGQGPAGEGAGQPALPTIAPAEGAAR